jgi:hypothetical protein
MASQYLPEKDLLLLLLIFYKSDSSNISRCLKNIVGYGLGADKHLQRLTQDYPLNITIAVNQKTLELGIPVKGIPFKGCPAQVFTLYDKGIQSVIDQINNNLKNSELLLNKVDSSVFTAFLPYIHFQVIDPCIEKIERFLKNYMALYCEDELTFSERVAKRELHQPIVLSYLEKECSIQGQKHLLFDIGSHLKNIPSHTAYRFIEYFLWLQIKEHIAIKSFSLSERSSTNFIAEISVIRHPNEIAVLEKECVKIGDLSFNPDTGHARCGKYSHHFKKSTNGYKILAYLVKHVNQPFSAKDLAIEVLNEDKNVKDEACKQIIHDVVHKNIRKNLGFNENTYDIDIVSSEGCYKITYFYEKNIQLVSKSPVFQG